MKILTFTEKISGLSAPSLHSQYYEEFMNLSKFLDIIIICSTKIENLDKIHDKVTFKQIFTINKKFLFGISKMINYPLTAYNLRKQIDLIYVRSVSPPEIFTLWFSKFFVRKPTVLTIGGTCIYEPLTFKNRIFRWIFSNTLNSVDKIVVYSSKMIPYIKQINPNLKDEKFEIIHNAINHKRFIPTSKNKELLKKLSIPMDYKVIMFVGRLNEKKGVIDILNVANKLKNKKIKFVFVGELIKNSSDYKKIIYCIDTLKLNEHICLTSSIPNSHIVDYLSCADIYIYMPKKCEGIPRSILEAMGCGKPVIATGIAGIPEAVISGQTGFIVNNSTDAAKMIENILSDQKLYDILSKNCREKIVKEFSYDSIIPKMIDFFSTIITK
jgi:glycosyltransferase involved in cell wall biosynthesis